nr:hypothetical protein [Tanacetum cinerariifolium]
MTRSSTKDLLTPFEEPERVFHSTRKLLKTTSVDYSSSPKFDLFFDPENHSEKEVTEAMGEPTMEQYMMKTPEDYGSGIVRPKIDEKAHFELNGQFLKELHVNTFSGLDNDDANEHIEKVFEIVGLFHIPRCDSRSFNVLSFLYVTYWSWNSIRYEDYEWYDTIEDSELKEEPLINKRILEESINVMKESSDDEWDHDSPVDEWKDCEHTTSIETDAYSNQNTYNNVCQIVMDHNDIQEEQGWFDEHEFMGEDDDDISDLEDYLIQKDPPYYVNEEEERSKERRCKLHGIPYVKPPT